MRRYTIIFITGMFCVWVGTSCDRDDVEDRSDAEAISAGDASQATDSIRGADAKSPSGNEEAGAVDSGGIKPVVDGGATDDVGPIVQPNTGGCSPE